jgi:hypothetical protein
MIMHDPRGATRDVTVRRAPLVPGTLGSSCIANRRRNDPRDKEDVVVYEIGRERVHQQIPRCYDGWHLRTNSNSSPTRPPTQARPCAPRARVRPWLALAAGPSARQLRAATGQREAQCAPTRPPIAPCTRPRRARAPRYALATGWKSQSAST